MPIRMVQMARMIQPIQLVRLSVAWCVIAVAGPAAWAQSHTAAVRPDASFANASVEGRVDALLDRMTLDEKVGQLVLYSNGAPTGPGTGRTDYHDMVRRGEIGGLFNLTTAKEINEFQRLAVKESRLHIPILFGLDVIHGFRTTFPVPLGLASTWNPTLVEEAARVAGHESAAAGVRWTFSPMVDIARDARWGRMIEGAGEDPYLGEQMARAYVRGYQGKDLAAPGSIAACVKHFVGYGAAEGGRDYNTTEISEHTLRQFYLPPFKAAVDEGAASLMSAFSSLNAVPTSANSFTLNQVLRKEWKFRGLVTSDWTSIAELMAHGIANDGATAARRALTAGVEMDMESNLYHLHLAQMVKGGQVPVAVVDEAVRRVLRVKFALGLFDHPLVEEDKEASAMLLPASRELARKAAEESFVLLKNDAVPGYAQLLPLSSPLGKIALIGPLADDAGNMLGSWAGQGRAEDAITLRTALTKQLGADRVLYASGGSIIASSDAEIASAVAAANLADVVVLAVGEDAGSMTAEAGSRAHLDLPGRQEQLLEAVAATGKPVVMVLFSGRPLTLPWAFAHVPAVLEAWFPGLEAGPALVQTLFGEVQPSGRLVVSWPRSVGQEPLYYNALNTGRPALNADLTHPPTDGLEKYLSRYIDEPNSPQFPFGFGLTYSAIQYGDPHLSDSRLSAGKLKTLLSENATSSKSAATATVSAEITNTGAKPADEVVQLYVRLEGTSTAQPVRALKGFQKIHLAPGETRRVSFDLGADTFALWDDQNHYTVEPARVTLWIAPDSAHGNSTRLMLEP